MSEMETVIMQLIIHAGDGKTKAHEALREAKEGNYKEVENLMKLAHEALIVAHNAQTSLLHKEAAGEKVEITALFVHAQDHLMTSMSEINLIEQILDLRIEMNHLKNQLAMEGLK